MRDVLSMDPENLLLQIGILEMHIAAENFFEAEALAASLSVSYTHLTLPTKA